MNDIEEENTYSEEIQEIIGKSPSWTVSWGISLIFLILLFLVSASWFIKYPDIIQSRVVITTQIPPVNLFPKLSGKINLFVAENQKVSKNDILAEMENPAELKDIHILSEEIEALKIKLNRDNSFSNLQLSGGLQVGDVQQFYLTLKNNIRNFEEVVKFDIEQKQIGIIEDKIEQYKQVNEQLEAQRATKKQEVGLVKKRMLMDSLLHKQKVLAEADVDRAKVNYLQTKHTLEIEATSITNNLIMISQLRGQIVELNITQKQSVTKLKEDIITALSQVENQIKVWKQHYLIVSPVDGTVSINNFLTSNQTVSPANEVFSIVPTAQLIYGQVHMPVNGSGKVAVGQKVIIKLDNYPFSQYGLIYGSINAISTIPRDNLYLIKIDLKDGLKTSFNKKLEFKQQLSGTAEIITENLSVFDRIFFQIRAIFLTQ